MLNDTTQAYTGNCVGRNGWRAKLRKALLKLAARDATQDEAAETQPIPAIGNATP